MLNIVPTTLDEYCIKTETRPATDEEENFDWDPYDDDDDEDEFMDSDED